MISLHIGVWSFAAAAGAAVVYVIAYCLKSGEAWLLGKAKSTERFYPRIVFFLVLGFVGGTLCQSLAEHTKECRATGQPIVVCMMFPFK